MDIQVQPPGVLSWRRRQVRCAIGFGGIGEGKREGDGVTPVGCFPLRRVMYRPDRRPPPGSALPRRPISPADGWCDDPTDANYNRLVRLPCVARHEVLWRDDGLYDILVELGYNDDPVTAGRGSAIFLHVAGAGYPATRGCVAISLADLLSLLGECDAKTRLCVGADRD